MILGNTQTFTAKVTNAPDTTVVWAVNGVEGGSGAVGIISATGMYTAPVNLPVPETLKIAATSLVDTTKSGVSQVAIASDLQIALSTTAAAVELEATKVFRPLITSSGHPNDAVRWALSGATCPAGRGAVEANGSFTAPRILPSPATATLTAQSIADPSRGARGNHHHQQFHPAAFGASERAGGAPLRESWPL